MAHDFSITKLKGRKVNKEVNELRHILGFHKTNVKQQEMEAKYPDYTVDFATSHGRRENTSIKQESETAYFFGYGNAAMYRVFYCQEFNKGVSGCNDGKIINREQAIRGVNKSISFLSSYPDIKEVDKLKAYVPIIMESGNDALFFIHFSWERGVLCVAEK